MKLSLRIAALILLTFTATAALIYAQAGGTGPVASISYPVLPTLPTNLRTTPTQFTWDYDFTQPLSRACSTTVLTACVSGFTTQTVNQLTNAIISGPFAVSLPATISTTGPTVGIAAPFTPPTALGQYAVQVIVNWRQ